MNTECSLHQPSARRSLLSANMEMYSGWKLCPLIIIVLATCIREGLGIKCWDCRSDYDPQCADPIDNSTLALVDCNQLPDLYHLPGIRPTMCRKMRQKVNGEWRIIRGCAYLGEPGVDGNEKLCLTDASKSKMFREYCICNNRDGCNTGSVMYSNQFAPLLGGILSCLVGRFHNR